MSNEHSPRRTRDDHRGTEAVMGEWKAQLSLRVRQDLRRELEAFAEKERRKLGNVGEVILEWGFEQLKTAGSLDRLLKYQLGKRKEKNK